MNCLQTVWDLLLLQLWPLCPVSSVLCPLCRSRTRTVGRILRICVGLAQLYEYGYSCTGEPLDEPDRNSYAHFFTVQSYGAHCSVVPSSRSGEASVLYPNTYSLYQKHVSAPGCAKRLLLLRADSDQRVGTVHVKKLIPTDLSEMMSQRRPRMANGQMITISRAAH
jgi:hypothetical protein